MEDARKQARRAEVVLLLLLLVFKPVVKCSSTTSNCNGR